MFDSLWHTELTVCEHLFTDNVFLAWESDWSGHHFLEGFGEEHQEGRCRNPGSGVWFPQAVQGGQRGPGLLLRLPELVWRDPLFATSRKRVSTAANVSKTIFSFQYRTILLSLSNIA